MRRRRALIVRIVAATAMVAATLLTAGYAGRMLSAKPRPSSVEATAAASQKYDPGEKSSPSPDNPPPPSDVPPQVEPRPLPSPGAPPVELNPLPPAVVTPPAKPSPSMPVPSAASLEDPEGSARAFVEKSQKEADEAIRSLTKEAETLRARLQKVEAGLNRWQAVKSALEAHPGGRQAWRSRDEDNPDTLVPAPDAPESEVQSTPPRPSRTRPKAVSPRRPPGERDLPPSPREGRSPFDLEPPPSVRPSPGAEPEIPPTRNRPARPDAVSPPPSAPKADTPRPAGESKPTGADIET